MSNSGKPHLYPTAPVAEAADDFHRGAPPPSYEESLKMPAAPAPQYYQQPPVQQVYQFPTQQSMPMQYNSSPIAATSAYGYVNPYQTHIQQQHVYYNTASPSHSQQASNVLHFDKRAEIRTTAKGAISVPPPPPGCAPTPAQLAAMSGQPVMIKQKKKTFF